MTNQNHPSATTVDENTIRELLYAIADGFAEQYQKLRDEGIRRHEKPFTVLDDAVHKVIDACKKFNPDFNRNAFMLASGMGWRHQDQVNYWGRL